MKLEDVLSKLEKHEAECALRYARIEERLDDQKQSLNKFRYKNVGAFGCFNYKRGPSDFTNRLVG